MKSVKYIIVGAGISGLAFAEQKKDEDYIVFEKASVPGGLAQTFHEQGFVWDVAGHFFHFHSDNTRKYYEELMKGKIQVTATKCAKVYYAGQYMNAPFQYNIHQLSIDEFIECLTDLYYADCPESNIPFDKYVQVKYGAGIANKFLIPYNEKLYACKMNELERDSMGGFLPKLDFKMLMSFYRGSKGETYNDTFRYPVNGCQEIIDALINRLDTTRIHFDEAVCRIDTDKKIVYTTAGEYKYQYLINSMALNDFAKMIGEDSDALSFNKVLVLNIGFDKPSIDKQVSWVYYPGDEFFYRVGFYNNIAGTDRLSVYVEIGYGPNETIDVNTAMQRTLNDLKRVNVIDEHEVIAYKPYIINPGYVHVTTKGKEFADVTIRKMKQKEVYMIGRYARWEYSAMDDSLEQAFELAREI